MYVLQCTYTFAQALLLTTTLPDMAIATDPYLGQEQLRAL